MPSVEVMIYFLYRFDQRELLGRKGDYVITCKTVFKADD